MLDQTEVADDAVFLCAFHQLFLIARNFFQNFFSTLLIKDPIISILRIFFRPFKFRVQTRSLDISCVGALKTASILQ